MVKRRKTKTKTKVVTKYRTKPLRTRNPYRRSRTSLVSKIKKLALPIGLVGSFAAPYLKRSHDSGSSIPNLLREDVTNFDTGAAMSRVKEHIPQIVAPIGVGMVVKETRLLGKYSGVAGELLLGIGLGTAAKAILDPPFTGAPIGTLGAPLGVGSVPIVAAGNLVSVPASNPYGVV